MAGTFESLGFAYGPLLEAMASTHILCAAAIESHINARGSELLGGKLHEKFEFADLEFKWIILPKLIGREGDAKVAAKVARETQEIIESRATLRNRAKALALELQGKSTVTEEDLEAVAEL